MACRAQQLALLGCRPRTSFQLLRQKRQAQPQQPQQRRQPMPCQAAAGGLQEGLSTAGLLQPLELPGAGGWQALQLAVVGVAAYTAAVWPDRPRGWCRKDLVQVRPATGFPGLKPLWALLGQTPHLGSWANETSGLPADAVLGCRCRTLGACYRAQHIARAY